MTTLPESYVAHLLTPDSRANRMNATINAMQESYVAHLASILDHLIKLQNWKSRQLESAERQPIDWRDVGDAAHVDDLLAMACEFLEMEPETPHPNRAGVKYAVYLSPKQGEAAMILGNGDVNAGIVDALDQADMLSKARCQVCERPHLLGYICEVCYEDRCA